MAMAKGAVRMPGGPDWLHLKGRAELRSDEEGYAGAWFEVVIGRLFPASKQAWVEYIHFVDGKTGAPHEEFVRVDNLRPLPPVLPSRTWKERDSVETYYNNAWWVGYIKGRVARDPDKYLVFYGKGEQDLEIHAHHIRPRQNYIRPSKDCPKWSWSVARPMQNPAIWERIEETPVAKAPVAKTGTRRPDVGKIQPRVRVGVSDGDESDDSWDAGKERRQKKRPRVQSTSKSKSKNAPAKLPVAPRRKIRFVSHAKPIAYVLPAINPPAKVAEQSTLVLTPGSSPPLADSPFQDSAISPGSDSQAQKPLANSEASPPTRSSASNSSSRGSGSPNSSSSGEDDDDCVQISGNGGHSEEEDVSIGGRMSNGIFPDFSNDEASRNKKVYQQLLVCFKHDSKGMLDSQRHNILTAIRKELKLSTKDVNAAHCLVFGLPMTVITEM